MSGSPSGLKVGIFGVGAIGQTIAAALDQARKRGQAGAILVALADQDGEKAGRFAASLAHPVPVVSADELVRLADLIVEAASQAALPEIISKAIENRKDMMVMSVGGLLGHADWLQRAEERGCRIHIPSGAIAGLDGLKSACKGRMDSVILTSRKPIAALQGAKYVLDRGINLDGMKEETIIFEGAPEEACRAFPATSNVAASLRFAVGASVNLRVRIVAAPGASKNVHEIEAHGDFGRLHMTVENIPSESNPRTSRLAALSALATLDGITSPVRVGT